MPLSRADALCAASATRTIKAPPPAARPVPQPKIGCLSRLLTLAGLLALAACASTVPEPTRALLADDLPLTAAAGKKNLTSFRKQGFSAGSYSAVLIRPAQYQAASNKKLTAEDKAALERAMTEALATAFGQDFALADKPGPGVLEVRAAITAVGQPQRLLNAVTMVAVFAPATKGGAAIEAEVIDPRTGEVAVALRGTATGGTGPKGYLSDDDHAEEAFRTLAEALRAAVAGDATAG